MTKSIISLIAVCVLFGHVLAAQKPDINEANELLSSAYPVTPKARCFAAFEGSANAGQCEYL